MGRVNKIVSDILCILQFDVLILTIFRCTFGRTYFLPNGKNHLQELN